LEFELDTTAPIPTNVRLDLDPATDTVPTGDGITAFDLVKIDGQTDAGTSVQLLGTGMAATAAAAGDFRFSGLPLEFGGNVFTFRATDPAGNSREGTRRFTRLVPGAILLQEGNDFVVQATAPVVLGQAAGTRTISFDVLADFDTTDQTAAIEDTLLVYLVDPSLPNPTLLDRGTPGTSLLMMAGSQVEFPPGLVRFNGRTASIDVTSLASLTQGQLKFQMVGSDSDNGSLVQIANIKSVVDPTGIASPVFPIDPTTAASGAALDMTGFTAAAETEVIVSNVRVGSLNTAEIVLHNRGAVIGRNSAIVFPGLPAGVTLQNASGLIASGSPYINLRAAIPPGGLGSNDKSLPLKVTFDNPSNVRFALRPLVLSGVANRAPVLNPIGTLSVMPGGHLEVPLVASDLDGDRVTYSMRTDPAARALPTGRLSADGRLIFTPSPSELGSYQFTVVATDGATEATRAVTLDVIADPITTTRISGIVQDVDGTPISQMQVAVGAIQGLTLADGSFTLDLGSGPVVGDTIKIRGELFPGPLVYPFIAEKLAFVLEHAVYNGVNNVIGRPIFLPQLDVARGEDIDPSQNETVTTTAIPGISLFVAAGTLMNQQGTPFDGVMHITKVPRELTPAALPDNLVPDLVVTIQPGEMVFASPAPMTFPNSAGWAPGTLMDLWSINPVSGEFDDVGNMQVSVDGTKIETISGGVRNSSWHFVAPPPPEILTPPTQDTRNHNTTAKEQIGCASATSVCELHSGAVLETHDLVSYRSLGLNRGLQLVYDSLRADPRPIVYFSVNHTQLDPALRLVADR